MFKWKKVGIIAGLSLSLIVAGCGSDDEETETESAGSVSEEMNYTITGIEPGAGQTETNEVVMDEYENLEGWEQELSSTGAMLTQLGEAYDNEEPIVISAWSPHYMFANWDLKFLDDPKEIFVEESFITIARKGLEADMPEAYALIDRFSWEISEIEPALLEAQGKDLEQVAIEWVEENPEKIEEWTEGIEPVDGDSVELALTTWDSETFITHVAGIVMEQHGFHVTLTPVDPAVLFEAISSGDADASLSPWMPVTHGALYEKHEGEFDDLGENIVGARIGLAVPEYMDIDSIEDLEPKE